MATLNGAIALMQVDDIPLLVTNDLHFDVLGPTNIPLEEDSVVSECATSLALSFVEEWDQVFRIFDHAHAATTATEGGLYYEWKADFLGRLDRFFAIANGILGSRECRDLGLFGNFSSFYLIAHTAEEIRARTDKVEAIFFTGSGKISIFREEAVAGVDEVDALCLGEINNAGDVEISGDRSMSFTDKIGFIRLKTVDTEAVFIGINRDSAVAEFGSRTKDTNSDFAAIGG
jgi:hypothetical protein